MISHHIGKKKMRQLLSALVLSLVMGTSVYASTMNYNSQKPVSCMTTEKMKMLVGGQYGELPYMQGDGIAPAVDGQQFIKTQVIVAVNLDTKTFSIVEVINENLACIIASGNQFKFNKPPAETKTSISWE
jgi:hypothetical protein